jgi:hypothetical protein
MELPPQGEEQLADPSEYPRALESEIFPVPDTFAGMLKDPAKHHTTNGVPLEGLVDAGHGHGPRAGV